MSHGTVLFYDANRNFGFIKSLDGDENIFYHGKAVHLPAGETLATGDLVEYGIVPDRRDQERTMAINVQLKRRADPEERKAARSQRYLRSDMTAAPVGRGDRFAAAERLFKAK
jgi:cold shock CspA family protein